MRYVAAYLLAVLAGNQSPDAAAIEKILSSVGVKVEKDKATKVINELKGKSIEQLIADGTKKLASVPSAPAGGAAPAAAAPAAAAKKDEPKKEEKKKEEKKESEDEDMGRVTIRQETEKYVTMQWPSDPISDMVSDSVVAMILNISREGPKVTAVAEAEKTQEEMEKMAHKVIYSLLVSLFGDVKVGEEGKLIVTVDGDVARLDGKNGEVECDNEGLKERVKTAFRRIQSAVRPIPLSAS